MVSSPFEIVPLLHHYHYKSMDKPATQLPRFITFLGFGKIDRLYEKPPAAFSYSFISGERRILTTKFVAVAGSYPTIPSSGLPTNPTLRSSRLTKTLVRPLMSIPRNRPDFEAPCRFRAADAR